MNKALIALPLVLLGACSGPRSNASSTSINSQAAPDLAAVLEGQASTDSSFGWFGNALMQSSISERMPSGESFTVLAVRDRDLTGLGSEYFTSSLSPQQFETVISFHVLVGNVSGRELQSETSFETLSGQRLFVSNWGGDVEVYTRGADGSRTSSATVVATDVAFDRGVVHFIDRPLEPATQTMGDMLRTTGGFEYLLAAAQITGADVILEQAGPFTLFAPTNEAFQSLAPWFDPASLDNPEQLRAPLLALLQQHLVTGRTYSDQFATGTLTSVGGGSVEVSYKKRDFRFDGASIVSSDIETSNGVIHVVDGVFSGN
jgi:uncharacterized surface protein with fasciclin (FAS1) repeats